MDRYKFLEHTADAKFQAYGKTLEEAFANAALALTDVVIEQIDVHPNEARKIEVISESKESLLYDFLEKILLLMETSRFAIADIPELEIKTKGKEFQLNVMLLGDVGLEKYDYKRDVKAITYNDMFIKEEKGKVVLQVVVDL
jgi:SHS2 domain-containing protein